LVMADNLLLLYMGWEGVGVCSYLLVGFWYRDPNNGKAARKAFVVTRVGDTAMALGLFLLFTELGTLDIQALMAAANSQWQVGGTLPVLATALLLGGAVGKSAQLPLHTWLPDAMAGPTPVSALIHAATMVTAGVYMVARLSFLFALAPITMATIATVGAATALFAATIGLVQRDIKKVLAYSTVSQLGYMFLAVGSGAYAAGIFHLTTHAFFKACLFLGAGSVIHAMGGKQDIFKFGGLGKKMRITQITFLLSSLAIAGIPPFSGFFSKDAILFAAFGGETAYPALYKVLWLIGLVGAGLTAFYMMRLYWLTFHGKPRMAEGEWEHAHESPWTMTVPLMVLAFAATVDGALGIPGTHDIFHHWLEPVVGSFTVQISEQAHHLEFLLMGISVLVAAGGLLVGWIMYRGSLDGAPAKLAEMVPPLHKLLLNKYFVDELYDRVVVRPLKWIAWFTNLVVDHFLIDTLAVRGSAFAVKALGVVLKIYQNGDLQRYLAAMLIGAVVLVILL